MNEPPNSRYRACGRSGQPMVWMTRSSGFATFQTSLTPSGHTWGLPPWAPPGRRGGCDVVAVGPHRRRRRDPERAVRCEHVHRLMRDGAEERHVLDALTVLEEPAKCARVHDCARQQVRTGRLALLEHRD